MRVYNLTEKDLDFRGKVLPANGGSVNFPELDVFISNQDRKLAQAGAISIGTLPRGWRPKGPTAPPPAPKVPQTAKIAVADEMVIEDVVEVKEKKLEGGWSERPLGGIGKKLRGR